MKNFLLLSLLTINAFATQIERDPLFYSNLYHTKYHKHKYKNTLNEAYKILKEEEGLVLTGYKDTNKMAICSGLNLKKEYNYFAKRKFTNDECEAITKGVLIVYFQEMYNIINNNSVYKNNADEVLKVVKSNQVAYLLSYFYNIGGGKFKNEKHHIDNLLVFLVVDNNPFTRQKTSKKQIEKYKKKISSEVCKNKQHVCNMLAESVLNIEEAKKQDDFESKIKNYHMKFSKNENGVFLDGLKRRRINEIKAWNLI